MIVKRCIRKKINGLGLHVVQDENFQIWPSSNSLRYITLRCTLVVSPNTQKLFACQDCPSLADFAQLCQSLLQISSELAVFCSCQILLWSGVGLAWFFFGWVMSGLVLLWPGSSLARVLFWPSSAIGRSCFGEASQVGYALAGFCSDQNLFCPNQANAGTHLVPLSSKTGK